MINEATTLQELLDYAVKSLDDVRPDEEFIVRDLFRGFEWSRISRGDRTKLGSMFFAYVGKDGKNAALPEGKTAQHQQIYKKL